MFHLHSAGICHGYLRPYNFLVDERSTILISDLHRTHSPNFIQPFVGSYIGIQYTFDSPPKTITASMFYIKSDQAQHIIEATADAADDNNLKQEMHVPKQCHWMTIDAR